MVSVALVGVGLGDVLKGVVEVALLVLRWAVFSTLACAPGTASAFATRVFATSSGFPISVRDSRLVG